MAMFTTSVTCWTQTAELTYLINVYHLIIFTLDGPLAAVFPVAVNFFITAAFLRLLAGAEGRDLISGDSGAMPNFLSCLRRSISG